MTPTDRLAAHPYRPIGRVGIAVAVVGVAVVVTWFVWAAVARHRLQREVDAIRAAGQPVTPAEMPNPPVADADNAAPVWTAAMAAVSTTVQCPASSNLDYRPTPYYPPGWWTAVRASEAANAGVFPIADAAAARVTRWGDAPCLTLAIGRLTQARQLMNVLADSALLAHLGHHDDARCMSRVYDALKLADAIDADPSTVGRLTADGIRATVAQRTMIVAADLDVGRPGSGRRRSALQLLADFRAAAADDPQRVRPVLANRALNLAELSGYHTSYPMLGPLVDLTSAKFLHLATTDVLAAQATDGPAAGLIYDAHPVVRPGPFLFGQRSQPMLFDVYLAYDQRNYTKVDWQVRAICRTAAIAVAVRLWRADHDGAWPPTLAALIPAYLPSVPGDPLVAWSPPIGYVVRPNARPDGSDRPLLIVGQRPPATLPPAEPNDSLDGRSATCWFDLAPWPLAAWPMMVPGVTGPRAPGTTTVPGMPQ